MSASYSYNWSIFQAWNGWKVARSADSDVCSEYELKRRARYLGIPVAQLRWVSSYRPDPIGLLERRMGSLSLDPDEIAQGNRTLSGNFGITANVRTGISARWTSPTNLPIQVGNTGGIIARMPRRSPC